MAKDQQAKEQITIFVEPEDLRKPNALSRATMAPRGALIRAAIKEYLELRKAEVRRG